jgi:hypothetical protein
MRVPILATTLLSRCPLCTLKRPFAAPPRNDALGQQLPHAPQQSRRNSTATLLSGRTSNFIEKASRLYEQKRRAGSSVSPLEMYVRRWLRWTNGGIGKFGLTDKRKTANCGGPSEIRSGVTESGGRESSSGVPLPAPPAEQTTKGQQHTR